MTARVTVRVTARDRLTVRVTARVTVRGLMCRCFQVRWADLEEKKQMEHRRRIGFCIGTDWSLLTDPHAEIPRM